MNIGAGAFSMTISGGHSWETIETWAQARFTTIAAQTVIVLLTATSSRIKGGWQGYSRGGVHSAMTQCQPGGLPPGHG